MQRLRSICSLFALLALWPMLSVLAQDRATIAAGRVTPALQHDLRTQGLRWGAPIFMRIFKSERRLEIWVQREDKKSYARFRDFPICAFSGGLGPKEKVGDGMAPEGVYNVALRQLNPASQFHLSFNLGYPNTYDQAHGRAGSALMVHGNCVSIGCYAMTDPLIEEIYTMASAALSGGQKSFPVYAFPFEMTAANLAAHDDSPWLSFWRDELMPVYAYTEKNALPPTVLVVKKRYVVAAGK
jgi:murein L,D-transpeptidase YafK